MPVGPFSAREAWEYTKGGVGLGAITSQGSLTEKCYSFQNAHKFPELVWNDSNGNNNTGWLSEQDYRSGVINVLFHVLRAHVADQVFQDGS